ncbi:MAG: SCP2 sterol-binding domain-containing protein [Candidatus Actinomarina sp.]
MIQDILKNFKNKLSNRDINLSLIYFEITDDNKIYNLETCDFISSEIDEEKFLKFKISTDSLLEIVEGKKHPEDLLFDEKVKISGDISILA